MPNLNNIKNNSKKINKLTYLGRIDQYSFPQNNKKFANKISNLTNTTKCQTFNT